MSQEKLRVGILGLGMAGGVMSAAIAAHPNLKLAAAADLQEHLRGRFVRDHNVPVESSAEALIAREDIDAVYVATPHQFHASHTIMALRRGKHVVVEKPMALCLADCDRMIEASRTSGMVLIVGHTHSFDPGITKLRELVAAGKYGEPRLLHAFNYTNFLYRPRRPEELDPAQGGGVLWNQIPHCLDSLRLIVNKPVRSVRAVTMVLDEARPVEGACSAIMQFDEGAAATFVYSGYDRFDSDEWFGWIGASGNLKKPNHGAAKRALDAADAERELAERQTRWSYGGEALASMAHAALPHFGHLIVSCTRGDIRLSPQGLTIYDHDGAREIKLSDTVARPSHMAVWDELYAAARCGVPPLHDGVFARGTVELCLAIAESAREMREITLAPVSAPEAAARTC